MTILKNFSPKAYFLLLVVLTFAFQPVKIGFEKGHHGWVSSHTLSIISRANSENLFLGYTSELLTKGGIVKDYFDRYPVLFAGISNLILKPFWDNLPWYIYLSRQGMNVLYLISIFLIFQILKELTDSRKALLATMLSASSGFLIKYKDMVHYDQPALVGCLWLILAIIQYEKKSEKKSLLFAVLLAPLMGRGYASLFFVMTWCLFRIVKNLKVGMRIRSIRDVSVLYLLLSIPLPTCMLAMNVIAESKISNITWDQTSIAKSAFHRLGLKNYKLSNRPNAVEGEKTFSWSSFVNNQIQRTFDFVTPFSLYGIHVKDFKRKALHYGSIIPKLIFQFLLLLLLVKFFKRFWQRQEEFLRYSFLIMLSGGGLWILVMRNLAYYHEYVTMYLFGVLLIVSLFLVDMIEEKSPRVLNYLPLVFLISLVLNFGIEQQVASTVNWQASAFKEIRKELKDYSPNAIFLTDGNTDFIEGAPHADDFFLSGWTLTYIKEKANYQIIRQTDGVDLQLKEVQL